MEITLNVTEHSFVRDVKVIRETHFSLYNKDDLFVSHTLEASMFKDGDAIRIFRCGCLFDEAVVHEKCFVGFYKIKPKTCRAVLLDKIYIRDFHDGDCLIIKSTLSDKDEFIRNFLYLHSYNTQMKESRRFYHPPSFDKMMEKEKIESLENL